MVIPENFFFAFRALIEGVFRERYQLCCVVEFCLDLLEGRSPYALRGQSNHGFVPCSKCLKNGGLPH